MLQFEPLPDIDLKKLKPYFSLRRNLSYNSTAFDTLLWYDYHRAKCALTETAAFLLPGHESEPGAAVPLCRSEDLVPSVHTLEEYFHRTLGKRLVIGLIDENSAELLMPAFPEYDFIEYPDDADYLYDAESLRTLAGRKYHKKKNHVSAFLRTYEGRFAFSRLSEADYDEAMAFLDRWAGIHGTENEYLRWELHGLHRVFPQLSELDALAGCVRIDGQMEALTIGTKNVPENMAIIHIEKANPQINGLYSYINQTFLRECFPEVRLVNREDDMGLPELRKAKESYHPVAKTRKWIMREK